MTTSSEAQTLSLGSTTGITPVSVTPTTVSATGIAAAFPPLEAGTRFGMYRIVGELGSGGMGQVYQAVQGTLERVVALKVMRPELAADPQFAERFLREARAAASVCHQNVVVIFDAGDCDGRLYMAFQFVAGGDLDAVLTNRQYLPVAESLLLIAGCCEGLQAIHEAGLVHRDIKPHNIFLDAQGRPKLGDFGLARQAQGADRMTMTGVGMGTPAYMAPEQAQGLADIDIRADIHALGGTLYTLLTGKPPFSGLTPWMVVNAVCNEPAPDPRALVPDLPEAVAAIVLKCLAKRRNERYATPTELRTDLMTVHDVLTGVARADGSSRVSSGGSLPMIPLPIGLRALQRAWVPLALTAAGLLALPLGLRPLLQINDHYRATTWSDASWWAGFLSLLVLSGVTLVMQVSTRRDRLPLSVPVIASTCAVWTAMWMVTRALLTAGDGTNSGWAVVASLVTWVAACGFLGWHVPRWWGRDPALAGRAYPRTLAVLATTVLVTVICHLAIADRPLRTTVQEESRSAWSEIRHAFSNSQENDVNVVSHPRSSTAANAVAWLAPLTLVFIAPACLAWRERRRIGRCIGQP